MKNIFLLILTVLCATANAFEIEGFAGANSTTYDDVSEANSSGVTARTKLNFYGSEDRGIFVNINARGKSVFLSELAVGYAWRTKGTWFFEGGAGLGYSAIFGSGLALMGGTGYRVSSKLFVNFPIIANLSGTIFWSPYIGYSF